MTIELSTLIGTIGGIILSLLYLSWDVYNWQQKTDHQIKSLNNMVHQQKKEIDELKTKSK